MNILIIEDERPACNRLLRLIENFNPTYRVLACLDSVKDSLLWLKEHTHPDLIFLDVHLSDGNSFEILRNAGVNSPVIFTTSHRQYLSNAFEAFTIDYLFKPIKREEFRSAMHRFLERLPASTHGMDFDSGPTDITTSSARLLVKMGNRLKLLELNNAMYYSYQDRVTILFSADDKKYPLDYSLDQIEEMLRGAAFFRINRQTIINFKYIADIITYSKSRLKIIMADKKRSAFLVSSERTVVFKQWLVSTKIT